ncbi:hypothetical protein Xszus_00608 [Xenorhabdus szentirmaii]|nr:hypothetical protein Xsze_03504 [Xenorhabdus szentirmaii DSM 16338]PHM40933.1 hypothetical protein Xszus_00608 [Xenorhabdus szentirmaii]
MIDINNYSHKSAPFIRTLIGPAFYLMRRSNKSRSDSYAVIYSRIFMKFSLNYPLNYRIGWHVIYRHVDTLLI